MSPTETVLHGGDALTITGFLSTEQYLQHNQQIADGLGGLGAALRAMAEQGVKTVYTDTPLVVAQDNGKF